jgi:hypothetical protein
VKALQREMAGLFGAETAREICVWFKASDYEIVGDKIRPRHPKGRGPRWIYPLTNTDLFLSFAGLGGGGEPFEEQVLSWVRENGLLRRREPNYSHTTRSHRTKDGQINHQPMTLPEFREEVVRAHNSLTLLKAIRCGDYGTLRKRIRLDPVYARDPGKDTGYYASTGRKTARAIVVVDGIRTEVDVLADEAPSDELVHEWAAQALEDLVEQKLHRMGLIFTQDTEHPRPLSKMLGEIPYRPRLTPRCPDLETALWFQFASLIGDKRPLGECSECSSTYVGPERRKTCSDRCRQARSRRLRK